VDDRFDVEAWGEKHARLVELLATSPGVRAAGTARRDEPAEAMLAHALADIDEECRAFANEHLPRVMNATNPDELDEALTDLREGLGHLVYHVHDSPYLHQILDWAVEDRQVE
jgi:hypothetical protein